MTAARIVACLILCAAAWAGEARRVRVWVSAYCPCRKCCGKSRWHPRYGITSTGKRVVGVPFRRTGGTPQYGIAADPWAVPYGSRIIFDGYNPSRYYPADYAWPVDDTGLDMRRAWRYPWSHPRVRDGTVSPARFIHLDFRFIHHSSAVRWARKHGGWQWVTIIYP